MAATVLLRLREGLRRGGGALLLLGGAAVLAIVFLGTGAVAGRYALASDVAVTLGYTVAVLYGAIPLAADRESRRGLLPAAVGRATPWGRALGNALGAAALAGGYTAILLVLAGAGAAAAGGVRTFQTQPFRDSGTVWLPFRLEIGDEGEGVRLALRVAPRGDIRGTPDRVAVLVDGERYTAPVGRPLDLPLARGSHRLDNVTEGLHVGVDGGDSLKLVRRRSFAANALGASVGPAIGAAAVAAIGVAAGANLGGAVAALLAALVLLTGAMRGFLLEATEPPAATEERLPAEHPLRRARERQAHDHERPELPGALESGSRAVVRALVAVAPDLNSLDDTDRVATGVWAGLGSVRRGALLLVQALLVATVAGGAGILWRRIE